MRTAPRSAALLRTPSSGASSHPRSRTTWRSASGSSSLPKPKRSRPNAVAVVGAGAFGVTAAIELARRGHQVTLLDPGPLPHPLAASTDISKVIRMEYGPDVAYMALAERARDGWLGWNAAWRAAGREPLYHETGVLMVCREPMRPGGFEQESFRMLVARGHAPERLDARSLVRRYPAWRAGAYVDGFYHAQGGYAESGRVMAALTSEAERAGEIGRASCRERV